MSRLIALVTLILTTPALAHPGHTVTEVAGHNHVVEGLLGLAVVAIAATALIALKRAKHRATSQRPS